MDMGGKNMGVLKKQIVLENEVISDPSLYDAFNDILSNFSSYEVDKRRLSCYFLKSDSGDIYYFDCFNYVFPKKIVNRSDVLVLNNDFFKNQFCCVRYNGQSIIVKNYDVSGVVEITSYFMTDVVEQLFSNKVGNILGDFLFQLSQNNVECYEKLHLGIKIVVKYEKGNLVIYDSNGNVIDRISTSFDLIFSPKTQKYKGKSFYEEVEKNVDYYKYLGLNYLVHDKVKTLK